MLLGCGEKPENTERTQLQGEHANSTEKGSCQHTLYNHHSGMWDFSNTHLESVSPPPRCSMLQKTRAILDKVETIELFDERFSQMVWWWFCIQCLLRKSFLFSISLKKHWVCARHQLYRTSISPGGERVSLAEFWRKREQDLCGVFVAMAIYLMIAQ